MPILTRTFIKSSLIFLVAALLVGAALAAGSVVHLPDVVNSLGPVYFHLFMVGWVTQFIFGVVYWMFPKISPQNPRGSLMLGWLTFGFLNAGLLMRLLGEPMNSLLPGTGWGWLMGFSALLQWLAGLAFIANTWKRVKEK